MNQLTKAVMLLALSLQAHAFCDLTKFRWGCSIYPEVHQNKKESNLIYCGSTRLYVSREQFKMISRYQRSGVRMQLKIDDVFFDGPCIAASFNGNEPNNYRF